MELIKNNYYRYSGSGNNFQVEFDKLPTTTLNHNLESKLAAQQIYDQKQGDLYLMYSGGLDSEFALSSFLAQSINIKPVFVKLCPNYNHIDLSFAKEFCLNRNIELIIIDIDFDKFVQSGQILSIAQEMECSIYHRSALAHAITKLDGTIICGDCEPYLKTDGTNWYTDIDEHEFSMGKFFNKHKIFGTPYFGCYTAEKFISYMNTDRVQDLINNKVPGKISSFSSKSIIYNSDSNYNLKHRPKLTGYEEIETLPIFQNEIFKEFEKLKKLYGGFCRLEIHKFIKDHT